MKRLAALLLLLPALAHADDSETVCRTHLKHLSAAVSAYKLIHNNPPAKLSDLYLDGLVDTYSDFVCPTSGTSITVTGEVDAKSDYALSTGDVLVRETTARHAGQALAAFADGAIKPVAGTSAPISNPTSPSPPPVATRPPETTTEQPDFSLVPPGTVIPPQQPPPPPPALGPRPTGYVGAQLQDTTTPGNGALVVNILRGSPAETSGLKIGDLVVALNGEPVENSRHIVDQLSSFPPGAKVSLLIVRNGRNQKVRVVLGTRPR